MLHDITFKSHSRKRKVNENSRVRTSENCLAHTAKENTVQNLPESTASKLWKIAKADSKPGSVYSKQRKKTKQNRKHLNLIRKSELWAC